jgi:Tfp pilus tip-associated adhesin PilY1
MIRALRVVVVFACFLGLFPVRSAQAQEALPSVLPEVLFLVEDSARMAASWDGDGNLTAPTSRWSYVREGIIQIVNNAPLGMKFGVAFTADGQDSSWPSAALESDFNFEPLAYIGMSNTEIVNRLNAFSPSASTSRTFAESYSAVLKYYFSQNHSTPTSWTTGPFQYNCNQLIVIMVGSDVGKDDNNPEAGFYTPDPLASGVQCNDTNYSPVEQACWADNVAHHAYNGFLAPLAGTGSVKTYSLLIDANSTSISVDAAPLFQSVANMGQGLFYSTATPGGIAVSFWNILNDTFSGTYSNAAISMSPDGSKLYGSYFEVVGGHPLYKGHLLSWNVDNDPTSANYGRIITGSGSYGEAWDAGQLLASREALTGETNQGGFNPTQRRNGYTAPPPGPTGNPLSTFYQEPLAFDGPLTTASPLTTLLVDEVAAGNNCGNHPHDFNYDCAVDEADAQMLVDFIRGVSSATFRHTGLPRGPWKMGDTGHSIAVSAPHSLDVIATDTHFLAYREKLALLPGMVYVASNAGMLHAFNVSNASAAHEGSEYWFYVPRAKATKDPASVYEFDGFQIDDLMRSGQTYVNEGKIVIDHVWLDGYSNGLGGSANFSACSAAGYYSSNVDGIIDPSGCEWHRIIVWSGGYGARHHYALDVTNPYSPRFLWERTDDSTSPTTPYGVGRAVGSPGIASFVDRSGSNPERRWLVLWGAGSTSPGVTTTSDVTNRVHASVYMHDINPVKNQIPTEYPLAGFKATGAVSHPHPSVSNVDSDVYDEYGVVTGSSATPELALGLFGSPSMVDIDGDNSVDVGYIGDSLGYLFKVRFNEQTPTAATTCLFASPSPSDQSKKLFYRPAVFFSPAGELLVYYGSGSPFDIYSTETGGLYVKVDGDPYGCSLAAAAPCAASSTLFDSSGFWLFDGVGEKLVGDPIAAFGRLFFTTHTPGTDPCLLGSSRIYGLDVSTCGGGIPDVSTDSYTQDSTQLYTQVDGLISQPVFANGQIYALNIDASGLDSNSMIDDLQVTPTNMANYFYTNFRHVY